MQISRRNLMVCAAGMAGLSLATSPGSEPAGRTAPIIDSHIHVWEQNVLNPPWLAKAPDVLRQRYMAEEYRQATQGLSVERAVYVEIAETEERRPAEAKFVTDLIREGKTPLAAAVIGGDPADPRFADYIKRFRDVPPFKGVRCFYRKDCERDANFVSGIKLLGDLGRSFDLVLGWSLLEGANRLVRECPDTFFVLDHCAYGNPDWFDPGADSKADLASQRKTWEQGVARLSQCKNLVCKISCVAEMSKGPATVERLAPVVDYCIRQFGDDRVLFGSNWPVCLKAITLAKWVEAVQQITASRGPAFARKLFHDNTIRAYRLGQ